MAAKQTRLDLEQQLCAQSWEQHPDRAVLLELAEKRDEAGRRAWIEVTRPDPTDPAFTNLWAATGPHGANQFCR
jgi:hypothetical protein